MPYGNFGLIWGGLVELLVIATSRLFDLYRDLLEGLGGSTS